MSSALRKWTTPSVSGGPPPLTESADTEAYDGGRSSPDTDDVEAYDGGRRRPVEGSAVGSEEIWQKGQYVWKREFLYWHVAHITRLQHSRRRSSVMGFSDSVS